MPIRKYRDVALMEDSPWRQPGDPELYRVIARLWAFSARACRSRFPPGVHRHRSFAEAERLREEWEESRVRARRKGDGSVGG